MRLAVVKFAGEDRTFQRVICRFGIMNTKHKKAWVDVTDSDYFTSESIYRFREPPACAACDDEAIDCPICAGDKAFDEFI